MTWDEARAAARTFGFEAIAAAGTAPVSMPEGAVHPQAMGLIADPHDGSPRGAERAAAGYAVPPV